MIRLNLKVKHSLGPKLKLQFLSLKVIILSLIITFSFPFHSFNSKRFLLLIKDHKYNYIFDLLNNDRTKDFHLLYSFFIIGIQLFKVIKKVHFDSFSFNYRYEPLLFSWNLYFHLIYYIFLSYSNYIYRLS